MESISTLVLALLFRSWSPINYLNHLRSSFLDEKQIVQNETLPKNKFETGTIPHPYLGFALNPDKLGRSFEFAYSDEKSLFQKRSADQYLIAFTGGSVAGQLISVASEFLTPELKKLNFFKDKEISYIMLARGGYKQPQQAMTISYLFSLGIELDLVINVDGFNESALPFAELRPRQVFPFYPRDWLQGIPSLQNPKSRKLTAKIYFLEEFRQAWANSFSDSLFRHSPTLNVIWKIGDILAARNLEKWKENQLLQPLQERSFFTSGPKVDYSEDSRLIDDIAVVWRRGSEIISAICDKYQVKYLHVLQPNQYFEKSKNLTKEELQIAYRADHPYREGVVKVYPSLQRQGTELRKNGILFFDLTGIFSQTEITVYNDQCCHFNQDGLEILNREIAKMIKAEIAQ